jgi:hypothetical protein
LLLLLFFFFSSFFFFPLLLLLLSLPNLTHYSPFYTLPSNKIFLNSRRSLAIACQFLIPLYTGCHRRNGPDFGRVFLRSNYTDITQNTYTQSSMVTEILTREECVFLWCLRTVLCPWRHTGWTTAAFLTLSLEAAHSDLGYGSDARSV